MQANKANEETKEQLAKWLQSSAGSGSISKGAKADLTWLQNSKDLSSVLMDPEKQSVKTHVAPVTSDVGVTGGGGGFLALFGCASKRK